MKIHKVKQGTPEWHALRAKHFNASEASSMMGCGTHQNRTELLTAKKTGIAKEVDDRTQRRFDEGHATEKMARPIVEKQLGEDLFPIVCTSGDLLASVDGATMDGSILFEHKLWNAELVACVKARELPPEYYWQLEQQLLVTGADKVIFVCSDGTEENMVQMEYLAVPGRADQLIAGWAQFAKDLADFVPVVDAPAVVGVVMDELPALRIELTGMVTGSNLKAFEASALAVIGSVKTELTTDQDFADAKKAVKWCGDVESAVAEAKKQALSQTASIDELFKSLDRVSANARDTRLRVDKLVKAQELSVKAAIKAKGESALADHIATLNKRLGSVQMPAIEADFAGAMKGKSKLANMRDAVDTELARAKIEANAIADKIEINLNSLRELADSHRGLFADRQQLVMKANDDLVNLIKSRISDHEKAEAEKAEAMREQIRKEELAKIERERLRTEAQEREKAMRAEAAEREQAVKSVQQSNVVEITAEQPKPTDYSALHSAVQQQQSARRPSDDEIISVLALHYRVHESKVIEWIITMDMESASRRMVEAI